jgi:DNA repair protein RadC
MIIYQSEMPELTIQYKKSEFKKVKLQSSKDTYDLLKDMYDLNTIDYYESVIILYLNKANNTIGWQMLAQGGLDGCVVDIRMIMSTALKIGATNLVLSHNHPTGQLKPSQADIRLTKEVKQAGEYLRINLLDHIIVTSDNGYFSFADESLL